MPPSNCLPIFNKRSLCGKEKDDMTLTAVARDMAKMLWLIILKKITCSVISGGNLRLSVKVGIQRVSIWFCLKHHLRSQLSAIWGNSFWFLVISLASSLSFLMNFVMARHEFSSMLKKSYGKRSDRCRFDVMKIMEVIRVVLVGGEQSDQFFIFEFETTPLDLEVYFSKF